MTGQFSFRGPWVGVTSRPGFSACQGLGSLLALPWLHSWLPLLCSFVLGLVYAIFLYFIHMYKLTVISSLGDGRITHGIF